jgi:Icc-related predicted phosphoesterase
MKEEKVIVYVVMGNDFPEAVFTLYKDAAAFVDRKLRSNSDLKICWRSYQFKLDEHAS